MWRVAIRYVRPAAMDFSKKHETSVDLSEYASRHFPDYFHTLPHQYIKTVDKALEDKEKEIMKV